MSPNQFRSRPKDLNRWFAKSPKENDTLSRLWGLYVLP